VCRPCPNEGKADAPREETSTGTSGTTGVGVQASDERSAEITSGRSHFQQGLTATCEDGSIEAYQPRRHEEVGLADEPVGARKEG